MLEKLKGIEERFEDIQAQLSAPEVYSDPALLKKLSREQKELESIVEAYRAYRQCEADIAAAMELMGEAEFKELAQEELHSAKERQAALQEELKILLLPRDPNDGRNVIMEIRGGVGGEEGMLFAPDALRGFCVYRSAPADRISKLSMDYVLMERRLSE